jgi:hypothetical protein
MRNSLCYAADAETKQLGRNEITFVHCPLHWIEISRSGAKHGWNFYEAMKASVFLMLFWIS